jgi:hypothetical protein
MGLCESLLLNVKFYLAIYSHKAHFIGSLGLMRLD